MSLSPLNAVPGPPKPIPGVSPTLQSSLASRSVPLPAFSTLPIKELRNGHRQSVRGLGFSLDGRHLASCSADRSIRIWTPDRSIDHRASTVFSGHTESVDQLAWSPVHPDVLASASADRSVRVWDTRNPSGSGSKIDTPGSNINIAYHPNGESLVVGDKSDTVSIVDLKTNRISHTVCSKKPDPYADGSWNENTSIRSNDEINELAFSPDGSLLLLSSGTGSIHIHSVNSSYARIHSHPAHLANVFCIQYDPLSRFVATASSDANIGLWDTREWIAHRMFTSLSFPARSIGFSFDGEFLAAGGEDGFISINAVNAGVDEEAQVGRVALKEGSMINTLAWHPSRHVLAFAGDEAVREDIGIIRMLNL